MDRTLYDLRDLINKELDEIVKSGKMTTESLCSVDKAVDVLKDIHEMEISDGEDYAMDYPMGYERRYSGRQRRDSRGRYSRGRDYMYEGSMVDRLEDMMRTAENEHEREMIRKWMKQAENG